MKQRPNSQASVQTNHKNKRFNTKGYFCNVQPYCQQYLKAKHAIYEKSKRLRQARNQGKQNNPVMFQFNKPKTGFYQLKGCKIQKSIQVPNKENKQISVQKQNGKGNQYLSYFLKKYSQRKFQKSRKQQSHNLLPAVKIIQPYAYPVGSIFIQPNPHHQSVGINSISTTQIFKPCNKKMRTQPVADRRKNRSCQLLQKKQNISYSQISNISVSKPIA